MSLLHISKNIRRKRLFGVNADSYALNGNTSVHAKQIFAINPALLISGFICIGLIAFLGIYLKNNATNSRPLNSELQTSLQTPSSGNTQNNSTPSSTLPAASTQQNNQSTTNAAASGTSNNSISANVNVTNANGADGQTSSSTQMSINGQPVAIPANGSAVHSSTTSPDQNTSLTISSNHANGSSDGFTNSNADVYVHSSSITLNQEGD